MPLPESAVRVLWPLVRSLYPDETTDQVTPSENSSGLLDATGFAALFDLDDRQSISPVIEEPEFQAKDFDILLQSSLALLGQALSDRQQYFVAGEKLANLLLTLLSDRQGIVALEGEAEALISRRDAAAQSKAAEQATKSGLEAQSAILSTLAAQTNPNDQWSRSEADRQNLLSEIRGFSVVSKNPTVPTGQWPGDRRVDTPWGPDDPSSSESRTIRANETPIVKFEAATSTRAVLAEFRRMYLRVSAELRGAESAQIASTRRVDAQAHSEASEEASLRVNAIRTANAEELLRIRTAFSRRKALLGFLAQMLLHRRRWHQTMRDAVARVQKADNGFREFLDCPVVLALEATNDYDTDRLFDWCRRTAAWSDAIDSERLVTVVPISLRTALEPAVFRAGFRDGWLLNISEALLGRPGRCVLMRGIAARIMGTGARDTFIVATPPAVSSFRRRNGTLVVDWEQPSRRWPLPCAANALMDHDQVVASRMVHNVSPLGPWALTIGPGLDADNVTDIVLAIHFVSFPD